MEYQKIICGVTVSILLSGCTTMQMLGESKEEFKKGNYGSGVFMGVSSLLAGPVIDVFTFGGALDGQQSTEVWTGVAQEYSNQQAVAAATQHAQKTAQLQAQQAALAKSVQQQSSYGTSSSNRSYGTINSGNVVNGGYSSGSGSTSSNSNTAGKTAPAVTCLTTSRSADGSLRIFNGCSSSISFRYCYSQISAGSPLEPYKCHAQHSEWANDGINYATQGGGLASGSSTNTSTGQHARGAFNIVLIGCAAPYIIPIISSVNGINGRGYCRNPN